MKVGKHMVISKLGHGCSRKAVLLDNGMVCKLPRYDSHRNMVAGPNYRIFSDLFEQFKEDKQVAKVQSMMAQGFELPAPCVGILVEYLLSLKMENLPESKFFAKCVKIKVRKKRSEETIDIKGFYENAFDKEVRTYNGRKDLKEFPYFIGDLHRRNLVNGYIVDYADISLI